MEQRGHAEVHDAAGQAGVVSVFVRSRRGVGQTLRMEMRNSIILRERSRTAQSEMFGDTARIGQMDRWNDDLDGERK